MSSDASKKIIDQFKALNNQANITKTVKESNKAEKPFSDFMQKDSVANTSSENKIVANTTKALPSLNKISKEINNFKFDIDDEINNIY